jgi:hypothetical protein
MVGRPAAAAGGGQRRRRPAAGKLILGDRQAQEGMLGKYKYLKRFADKICSQNNLLTKSPHKNADKRLNMYLVEERATQQQRTQLIAAHNTSTTVSIITITNHRSTHYQSW